MKSPFLLAALALISAHAFSQTPKSGGPANKITPPSPGASGGATKPIGAIIDRKDANSARNPGLEASTDRIEEAQKKIEAAAAKLEALKNGTVPLREPIIQSSSILKVNATSQGYNPHIPWQKESPQAKRGLGVVLTGNRVLVTAQMVADATYIELELPESGQRLPAKVQAVDYEANVALLAPGANGAKEKEFFASLKPMTVDTSARIGDTLAVWQTGRVGDLIVTPLRISKVLTQRYVVEGATFLVYEAQGIIRSEANSFTLPVVKGGKLAGLLLTYDSKNQVATILPAPIIEHFLKDTADGKYEGFPSLGVEFQQTLDEQFRDYLDISQRKGGVFVSGVMKGASADKIGIKKGDIVLSINGYDIDSRSDYQDPQFGALSASHLVRGRAFVGEQIAVKVLREGKEITLTGQLIRKQPQDHLVAPYIFDRGPNYIMMGGLLFQELSKPYLGAFGGEQQGGAILRLARIAEQPESYEEEGRRKLIFLSAVLPTPSTQGYERMGGQVVNSVNGKKINDLADLDAAFKTPQDGIHTIELADFPKLIHLDAIAAERDNLRVTSAYRISSLKRIE